MPSRRALPGWSHQPLPSRWFSGYLDYDFERATCAYAYVLVLAQDVGSRGSVDDDKPLIYWVRACICGLRGAFGLIHLGGM